MAKQYYEDKDTGQWFYGDPNDPYGIQEQRDADAKAALVQTPATSKPTQSLADSNGMVDFFGGFSGQTPDEYRATLDRNGVQQAPLNNYNEKTAPGTNAIQMATNSANAGVTNATARNQQRTDAFTDKNLQPALDRQFAAQADQITADRGVEQDLARGGDTLNSLLAQTQQQRLGGISTANNLQSQGLQSLQSDLAHQDLVGDEVVNKLTAQMGQLNQQDKAAYLDYINKTNPMLAAQIAKGSDAKYVGQQQDVYNKYKELSNPEVTAQERFLGELARRQTENNDKSSRDATYAALQAKGLNSGGQQIASQYAARQNTAQDRVLAELGLSASAVGRSMNALQGQATVADSLRNADDKMRNFSDSFAQQDAIRRQSVAQGQADTGLKTTGQAGDRNIASAQAGLANNQTALARSNSGFDATSKTAGDNFTRDQYGYDSADRNAATGYGVVKDKASATAANRASEAGTAAQGSNSAIGGVNSFSGVGGQLTAAQIAALNGVLGNTVASNTKNPDDEN